MTSGSDLEIEFTPSPDKLSVLVSLVPVADAAVKDAAVADAAPSLTSVSKEKIEELLVAAGYEAELDDNGFAQLSRSLSRNKPVNNLVIAKGRHPLSGENGEMRMTFQTEQSIGILDEQDKKDYWELSTVQSVKAGQVICQIIPPKNGTPGKNVLGEDIPAQKGKPASVKLDKSVEMSKNNGRIIALIDGMVLFVNNTLSVNPIYETRGDVDFSTGNIHMNEGSVVVNGTVHSGFKVEAHGSIKVTQSIEECEIFCGGDLEVGQGIIMSEKGCVKAGGNVAARFISNGTIESGGEVVVANSISNCQITAVKKVIVSASKGRIQGGTITSQLGVEAQNIGSGINVTTHINIVSDTESLIVLEDEKRELQLQIDRLFGLLGIGTNEEILNRAEPRGEKLVRDRLKTLNRLRSELAETESKIIKRESALLRMKNIARVKVADTIHQGVVLNFYGHIFNVITEMKCVQFYYNPESNEVLSAPVNL
ncbi:MAG: DUF342 domain-containing protein [Deltaproteobacteria bacterium]|nr:DUF342 domain-containing protein [Deltaproteobacteria bacterium]